MKDFVKWEKWREARKIVKSCADWAVLLFTADKESTLLLELRKGFDIPVIFIDTGLYHDDVYQYLELAENHWQFKAVRLKNEEVIKRSKVFGKKECYDLLKKSILLPYLKKKNFSFLIEPLTTKQLIVTNEDLTEICPLSGFSEFEIWQLIREHNLPYCDLYNKGYKDVGCEPCSRGAKESEVSEINEKELQKRLKSLGYL